MSIFCCCRPFSNEQPDCNSRQAGCISIHNGQAGRCSKLNCGSNGRKGSGASGASDASECCDILIRTSLKCCWTCPRSTVMCSVSLISASAVSRSMPSLNGRSLEARIARRPRSWRVAGRAATAVAVYGMLLKRRRKLRFWSRDCPAPISLYCHCARGA